MPWPDDLLGGRFKRLGVDLNAEADIILKGQHGGDLLLVSQFTLAADLRRGHRPGFDFAMRPDEAHKLYDQTVEYARSQFSGM